MSLPRVMLSRGLISLASVGAPGATLSTFIFHRVLPQRDPLLPWEPDAEQFDWMLRLIASSFDVMGLADAVRRLNDGSLPRAAAAITFDDGYADNLIVALPLLKRHRLSATLFVATAFLDGGRMWNDDVIEGVRAARGAEIDWARFDLGIHQIPTDAQRVSCYSDVLRRLKYASHADRSAIARELARDAGVPEESGLMMTRAQLREFAAAGMDVGGHTRTHPILRSLSDESAFAEITGGRDELEGIVGRRVELFAYPNGVPGQDYSRQHVEMVRRAGFRAAVSTEPGVADAQSDCFQLPRFTPWDRSPLKFAVRCAMNIRRRSHGPRLEAPAHPGPDAPESIETAGRAR